MAELPIFFFDAVDGLPEFQAAISRIPTLEFDDLSPRTRALTIYHGYVALTVGSVDGPRWTRYLWEIGDWMAETGNVIEQEWLEDVVPVFNTLTDAEQTLAAAVGGAAAHVFTGNWSGHGNQVRIERDGWPFSAADAIAFETVLRLADAAGVPAQLEPVGGSTLYNAVVASFAGA